MPRKATKALDTSDQLLQEVLKVPGVTPEDADLIRALAQNIARRWNVGTVSRIQHGRVKAVGAILAVLELVRAVGDGKHEPDVWKGKLLQ